MRLSAYEFMAVVREAKTPLTPCHSAEHVHVQDSIFDFADLSAAQEDEFCELYRRGIVKFTDPGTFLVEPHFMRWTGR